MPQLVPVDFDPFAAPPPAAPKLVPVDFDPFAAPQPTGLRAFTSAGMSPPPERQAAIEATPPDIPDLPGEATGVSGASEALRRLGAAAPDISIPGVGSLSTSTAAGQLVGSPGEQPAEMRGPYERIYEGASEMVGDQPLGISPETLVKHPALQSPVYMLPAATADAAYRTLLAIYGGAAGAVGAAAEQITGSKNVGDEVQKFFNLEAMRRGGEIPGHVAANPLSPEATAFLKKASETKMPAGSDPYFMAREPQRALPPPDQGRPEPSAPSAPSAEPARPAPPPDIPPGALPAETILRPIDEEVPPPVAPAPPKPSLEDIMADPRSADEIRAEMAADAEAVRNFQPSVQWQEIPATIAQQVQGLPTIGVKPLEFKTEGGKTFARIPPAQGTRDAPVPIETPADVHMGAEITEQPTPPQAEAGNYQKRHVEWQGFDIAIETEKGGLRTGIGGDGKPWSNESPAPYGYIKRTKGKDREPLDITLGDNPQAPQVFVVDQIDPATLKFDEHKSFGAFNTEAEAVAAYNGSFSDGSGPSRMGAITPMSVPEFQAWVDKGNTGKALAYKPPVAPSKPSKPTGPLSLQQFIASKGGLRPDPGGELKSMGLTSRSRIVVPGMGYRNVIRNDGMDLDQAREAAVEMGYLHDPGRSSGGLATTTPNDLLELLRSDLAGQRTFPPSQELTDVDREAARGREAEKFRREEAEDGVRAAVKEHGLLATDEQVREATELALTQGADPLDAIDHIIERDALADIDEAAQSIPQERKNAAQDDQRAAVGESQGGAQAVEQPARPGEPQAQAAPPRIEPGQDQQAKSPGERQLDRILANNKRVRARLDAQSSVTVNRDYDIPAFAGYSKDAKTIYVHRGFKGEIPADILPHEVIEKALIDALGWGYEQSHALATIYGHRSVKGDIAEYEANLRPHIQQARADPIEKTPPDLDLTPYKGEERKRIEAAMTQPESQRVTPTQTTEAPAKPGPSDSAIELPAQMTRASLNQLIEIKDVTPDRKAAIAKWIEKEYARFEEEGAKIAEACLEQGGGFSIR
jgi:hypothetical protein